uniref:28 kDa ribonucleoprotein, chloroplastic isoform X2 n=1 Tax=Elaeis guineensis var. tenera TaxID=51953 RepID=A0A6I9SBZ3_ELAGV|nr:28 kDa ribonucleoprotein, chloroplastic isoform X2 [Elaeis guineensis]
MAATAAVGSYFSTAATPQLSSKLVSSDVVLRVTCARPLRMPTITNLAEHFSIPVAFQKWRLLRISAAVAQEEATAAVQEEEEEEEEEKETMEESGKGEEVVVAAPAQQNTKLYFGNLPYSCDSAQLAGIIQEYANPELVEVLYDRDTGRSRGFAFVTMSSIEDCEAVIQNLDGSQYSGRTMRVNFSDKPKPKEPLYPESDYKLFVGNLSWSVTSENLTQAFQEYGNVVGARVLYDGDTGRSRGYGFVCYSTKEEMDAALQYLNGAGRND